MTTPTTNVVRLTNRNTSAERRGTGGWWTGRTPPWTSVGRPASDRGRTTGSRLQLVVEAARIAASTRIVGRADSIRRTQNSAASTTPEHQQQDGRRPQRGQVVRGDRTVDDLLDHQGKGQPAQRGQGRGHRAADQRGQRRSGVRQQPAQGPGGRLACRDGRRSLGLATRRLLDDVVGSTLIDMASARLRVATDSLDGFSCGPKALPNGDHPVAAEPVTERAAGAQRARRNHGTVSSATGDHRCPGRRTSSRPAPSTARRERPLGGWWLPVPAREPRAGPRRAGTGR